MKAKVAQIISAAKDNPCTDCGIRYPACVMEFDHVRGEKYMDVSRIKKSVRLVQLEIEKCDLVCANCHRIRTMGRGWKNGTESPAGNVYRIDPSAQISLTWLN